MTPILLEGMHGFGDALHIRAVVRELRRTHEVWHTTSWPQLFWDMPDVHLLPKKSRMVWMAKNELRVAHLYGTSQPPAGARRIENGYLSLMPRPGASVLGIMSEVCGVPVGDFRMTVPDAWRQSAAAAVVRATNKPLLIYRPPMAISAKHNGSARAKVARNPDLQANHALLAAIRDRYFVVSLADCRDGIEQLVGPQIQADREFHHGELDIETIAGLFSLADLVFCSPGFALVLAQAVGAPTVAIFGGFECADSFAPGARYTPCCFIEPIKPCACWRPTCTHDKTIDLPAAHARIAEFIEATCKH